ncbi:MAG: glycosyltransferase family 4 protein [Nanoarchaeota archaeon]|nr:glycosyltransferase family 4 protein [Nanoarchaeota archaeon]
MIKKICFFTTHFDFPRQGYLNYFEKILPDNAEAFLFCSESEKENFNTKKIKKYGYAGNKFSAPFALRNFCKKNDIELVVNLSGMDEAAFTIAFASAFSKTKGVYWITGNPVYTLKTSLFLISQFFLERCLVSAKDITEKVRKLLIFKKKVFNVPLTVDTDFFIPIDKEKCRKKLDINKNDKIIIFVGRVQYQKGSDCLLELIKKNSDKKFILIGDLFDENYKGEKLDNLVLLPPKSQEELVEYYGAADLCVFPSRIEGFGLVPREAMSCGVPTIVSDIESLRMIEPAMKIKIDANEAQIALDKFFSLSEKQKEELSIEGRQFIIEECSEKNMRSVYLKNFFEIN